MAAMIVNCVLDAASEICIASNRGVIWYRMKNAIVAGTPTLATNRPILSSIAALVNETLNVVTPLENQPEKKFVMSAITVGVPT